jgi:hypothetical protein
MKVQLERDMKTEIEKAIRAFKGKTSRTVSNFVLRLNSPFTEEVSIYPLPPGFKMPRLGMFNGTRDPFDHLEVYQSHMHLQGVPDPIMCMAFFTTLEGLGRVCFNKIPPGSVGSFT